MDYINRFFGKKTEPSSAQEPASSDVPAPDQVTDTDHFAVETSSRSTEQMRTNSHGKAPEFGLKFILKDGSEQLYTRLPILIGRGKENDLVVNDLTVSDVHAAVYFDEAVHDVCIVDQESLNGLGIDGMPTRKNVLHDGVTINLGSAEISFRDTGYIHNQ